jgi:tetratricopeptide (TPR) repeat protein
MIARLVENDLDGALAVYSTFVRGGDGSETDTEEMINSLGYQLLDRSDPAAAAAVLSLNVDRYPESANAHDSLGEALAASGDRAAAIDHYRESLRLDPSNRNAEEMIDRLEE